MRVDPIRAIASAMLASLAAAPLGACGDVTSGSDGAGGAGGAGPGPTTSTGVPTPELESPFSCEDPAQPYEVLRQDLGLDSIELREQLADDGTVTTQLIVGEPCSTAADREACELAVLEARSEESLFPSCGGCQEAQTYLIHTRGDAVGVVASQPAMLAWIGEVETPAEAALVASVATYDVRCTEDWYRADGDDHLLLVRDVVADCPYQEAEVLLRVRRDGSHSEDDRVVLPETGACAGRRPEGLAALHASGGGDPAGAYFARVAHLEAASVDAFRILRDELVAHGAPDDLVRLAAEAEADELRHTAVMTGLARRHGAAFVPPEVERGPVRELEAMAVENAREGCVREAYGALEAAWQARHAADPVVRRAFGVIARDEARHADLSWRLAAWFDTRLGGEARARVEAARQDAERTLAAELATRQTDAGSMVTGLPTAERAQHLLAQLMVALAA